MAPPVTERAGPLFERVGMSVRCAALLLALVAVGARADGLSDKIEVCFACHGPGGISEQENVPSIAAQPSYLTQWQLVFYRTGSLKSELMQPVAAELTNDDIKALGAYLETLPPPKPPKAADPEPEMTKVGARLAVDRRCNNCHGPKFAGLQAAARLAGQREEVLLKALLDYKAGTRTGTGVAAMPETVFSLGEPELRALAHYLSRQP